MANKEQQSLKGLKCKSSRIKATLTKFPAYIDKISDQSFDIDQISVWLAIVKEFWSEIFYIYLQIVSSENAESEVDSFEDNYYDIVNKAEKLLLSYSESVEAKLQNEQKEQHSAEQASISEQERVYAANFTASLLGQIWGLGTTSANVRVISRIKHSQPFKNINIWCQR